MNYSVKAYLKTDKENKNTGLCPIELVINLNGKRTKITLSSNNLPREIWNTKMGLVNIPLVAKSSRYKANKYYYIRLNTAIEQKISELKLFMLEQERLKAEVSIDKIRDFFKAGSSISFYDFWDEQLNIMRPKLRQSTIMSYEDTKKILIKFKPRLDFGDINLDFIKKFENHLITDRKNGAGGRFNRHKNIKCILKEALRNKYIQENPYSYFKIEPAKGKRNFLTIEEVKILGSLELSAEHINLKEVLDMFLFSCHTGLRYSDIQNLKWKNVLWDEKRIEVKMIKTTENLSLMLTSSALQILNRLKRFHHSENFVFKRITNQALNRSLKILISDEAKIKKKITLHCARHTFACGLIDLDTSIYVVKDLLGHKDVQNTQIYAKIRQKQLDESMKNLSNALVA